MKVKDSIRSPAVSGQDQFQPLGTIFLVLVLLLAGVIVYMLIHRVAGETTPFDTDEASHATPALELHVAVQRRDTAHFWRAIFQQDFYPPIHSLTVLPSYLIAGPSLVTSRLATVVTFAMLLLAVAAFTLRTTSQISGASRGSAFVATATTVYFVSTSPVLIQNAVLCMLEVLGCLWVILLLSLCWRLDNYPSRHWARVWALALGLLVVSLTKYSFAMIAVPAVVAAILTGPKPHSGKRFQLIEAKDVLVVLGIGLGFWFVMAGFQGFLRFAFNQPAYAPLFSAENLFYYFFAWLNDFHLHPVFGFSTALLACWGAIKEWNRFTVRMASWVVCISFVILTISLNNQPRHFAFASPCIWFLTALGFTKLLVTAAKAGRSRSLQSISLIVMIASLGLPVFQRAEELQPELTYAFEGRYSDRNEAMQSYILDNVDFEGRILILGLFDQLNAISIRWQGAIATGRAPSEIFVATWPQSNVPPDNSGRDDYESVVLRAAAIQGYYSQIVVIHGKDATNRYVVAAPSALRDFGSTSKLFDDYRIYIYDFRLRR